MLVQFEKNGFSLYLQNFCRISFISLAFFEGADKDLPFKMIHGMTEIHFTEEIVRTFGAELMDISPEAFRKKLSRGRHRVSHYMKGICGHVDASNPCRCTHKVRPFSDMGMLDADHLRFHRPEGVRVREVMGERIMRFEKSYYDPFLARFRDQPFYDSPDMADWLNGILKNDDFKNLFHLNQ